MRGFLRTMLDMLTSAYNRHPSGMIGRLFSIIADALEGICATLDTIMAWRDIDQAKGQTLDRIGVNFGVMRGTASDMFYRLMIKIKITALLSGGDVDTVINAISSLLNVSPEHITLVENYPAKVWLYVDEDMVAQEYIDSATLTASIIFRVIAAGIGKRIFLRERYHADVQIYVGVGAVINTNYAVSPPQVHLKSRSAVYTGAAAFEAVHYTILPWEE